MNALHPHPASNSVDRIVAPHVFHKQLHTLTGKQSAAVDRASRFVSALLHANGVKQSIQARLGNGGVGHGERIYLIHQATKDTALPATSGHHTMLGARLHIVNTMTGFDGSDASAILARVPVDGDAFDLVGTRHQTLVAQVPQYQPFWMRA